MRLSVFGSKNPISVQPSPWVEYPVLNGFLLTARRILYFTYTVKTQIECEFLILVMYFSYSDLTGLRGSSVFLSVIIKKTLQIMHCFVIIKIFKMALKFINLQLGIKLLGKLYRSNSRDSWHLVNVRAWPFDPRMKVNTAISTSSFVCFPMFILILRSVNRKVLWKSKYDRKKPF